MYTDSFVTADGYISETDFCDVRMSDVTAIGTAFENGCKNVVFYSQRSLYSTACAKQYITRFGDYSNVIYARYDRDSCLYTKNMGAPSIDEVLKEGLCRPFVVRDIKEENCFAENYLVRFEQAADEKTLVVIDGYDVAAVSPYMRRLFSLPAKVLVLSQKCMTSIGDDAVMIVSDYEYEAPCLDMLSDRQKELLMTICAFLTSIDGALPIVSSDSGVFDEASLKYLLGHLADELYALAGYGLVEILPSGRIFVEDNVRKHVLKVLGPSADNCKTFMSFAEQLCNFRIMQNVKDISAQIYTQEDNYDSFAASTEFISLYSYFADGDENRGLKLYNMLMTYMLENFGTKDGALYTGHLNFRNLVYCLSLLSSELEDRDVLAKIYCEELYMDDLLPEIYTQDIKAKLDIIRLCVSFVRNSTPDMYKRLEYVFILLCNTMQNILAFIENTEYPDDMKLALADDVIRLCFESFDYCTVIDKDGIYRRCHDSFEKRRINYTGESESDKLYADSIMFGYSVVTVELYSVYANFLSLWLKLSKRVDVYHENALLYQLYEEKLSDREEILNVINAHYLRIVKGYENFFEMYAPVNNGCEILQIPDKDYLEKRIEDNKRYLRRGFDGGTKKGSLRYSELVCSALKKSKTPQSILFTVLCPEYPLSDETLAILKDKLVSVYCDNANTTNHSIRLLILTLVYFYSGAVQEGRRRLYEHMICELCERVNVTETFLERMYHTVSSMYVKVNGGFADKLYEKYCVNCGFKEKYSDDYIALEIYRKINNEPCRHSKKTIRKALMTYQLENGVSEAELSGLYTLLDIN